MALLRGELRAADSADAYNPQRWRRLADLGITQGDVPLALTCAEQAGDLSLSLLLYSCVGDRAALAALAARAAAQEQLNIAFLALYLTGDVHGCIELLQAHGKLPEAAFFALAYQPSQIAQAFAEWAPTIASILQGLAEVVSSIATAIMAVIQFLMPTIQSIIGVALETIKGVVSGALTAIKGLVDVFAGIFTGDWTRVWEGVKSIFSGVWNSLKSIASGVLNGIIGLVNGVISGLNKLKIPDWVPGIGGKNINIPLIPQFATGTDSTPDTFIAGERGAELITNAKNRSVFTAAQTGSIFRNLADTVNAIRTAGAAPYQLAYAGAPSVAAPTLNAGDGRASVVIHSAPVFHVGNDAQAQDIEEMLRRHDEELLDEIDERERQRQDDERRRNYD